MLRGESEKCVMKAVKSVKRLELFIDTKEVGKQEI